MALAVEAAAADPVNALEARAMTALAAVQARADARPAPFTTDGCSGGLSAGWSVLARRLDVSPEQVRVAFELAAEVMYAAVRLGGGPCTPFPWRWGYGWPECAPGLVRGRPRDGGDGP